MAYRPSKPPEWGVQTSELFSWRYDGFGTGRKPKTIKISGSISYSFTQSHKPALTEIIMRAFVHIHITTLSWQIQVNEIDRACDNKSKRRCRKNNHRL